MFFEVVLLTALCAGCAGQQPTPSGQQQPANRPSGQARQYVTTPTGVWLVHDTNRPAPPVVRPGATDSQPPSDAIVLFDGNDLDQWESERGGPARWLVKDGYMEVVRGTGGIRTKRGFGSCQLHIEFATPGQVSGSGQGRGNSGVFLQGQYEVQVLDSYDNFTYPDGQCGALYGRAVPLVNACRAPGQWQSFDIIYHRPIFDQQGNVVRKATFTVLHNGVLIHDHVQLEGGTGWLGPHAVTGYQPHPDQGPIVLQDHGNPVRFRNIWIRQLPD